MILIILMKLQTRDKKKKHTHTHKLAFLTFLETFKYYSVNDPG